MIAAALLALALADTGEITAHLRVEPAEAETGQPVYWILEVEHPAGATVRLPDIDTVADDSWIVLEPRPTVRTSASGGGETTRAAWSVLPLEPGDRPLPAFAVQVESDGQARSIDVAATTVPVRSALAAGEDAPRPIRGFHPAPERNTGRALGLLLGALALVAAGLALWIRRRRRRRTIAAAPPTPLQRLAELSKHVAEEPEAARRTIYALTRLLRESTDRLLGEDKPALDDLDWAALREADERLPAGARGNIARILRDAQRVKYALHAPTRFALEALIADAKNALEALAEARPPLEEAA